MLGHGGGGASFPRRRESMGRNGPVILALRQYPQGGVMCVGDFRFLALLGMTRGGHSMGCAVTTAPLD